MPFLIFIIMIVLLAVCWFWYEESSNYDLFTPPVFVAIIVAGIGIGVLMYDYTKTEQRTIVVEDKDRGGEDGSYRVYTDGDTLAVKDIWFSLNNRRTNSADLYGDIVACHKYVITTRGWELGLLSMMPNIDTIVEDLGLVEGCVPKD